MAGHAGAHAGFHPGRFDFRGVAQVEERRAAAEHDELGDLVVPEIALEHRHVILHPLTEGGALQSRFEAAHGFRVEADAAVELRLGNKIHVPTTALEAGAVFHIRRVILAQGERQSDGRREFFIGPAVPKIPDVTESQKWTGVSGVQVVEEILGFVGLARAEVEGDGGVRS